MKIIQGKKQVALVLSEFELRYIATCVGGTNDNDVKIKNDKYFPGTKSQSIGYVLWKALEKEVHACNKR